ncbi:MAG: hypothetical protein HZC26_02665 [Candidatus Magasanikbacteria bacterium]|nr:hypothetical protein [Candidatus Magasanikbacteria bacterium]
MNIPEDDVTRILQAVINTDRGDGWSDSIRVEMLLRKGVWKTKSTSFPTMVFGQFVKEGRLVRKSDGEATLYHVTKMAVDEFALNSPKSYNGGECQTGGGKPSDGQSVSTPADNHDKAREVVLAVHERADEDGLAQDTDIFTALRRSSRRWASIQWAYFSTEMNKLVKDGWLERGKRPKQNHYCLTGKGRGLLTESGTGVGDSHSPPPDQSGAGDLPKAEPPAHEPSAPQPPAEPVLVSPPVEVPEDVPQAVPPPHDDEVSDTTTAPASEEKRGEMKERAKKMPFADRVRLAWNNTPGKTAAKKQEYVFNRHATDALQKIFGVGSVMYAQQFYDRLREEELITDADGSYNWANDMSNYNRADGPKPGPRPRVTPEPPAKDVVADAGESTETDEFISTDDLHIVFTHAPWLLPALKAAALLGRMQQPEERSLALGAIKQFTTLSAEDLPQALNTLNAIFSESPSAEPEFD